MNTNTNPARLPDKSIVNTTIKIKTKAIVNPFLLRMYVAAGAVKQIHKNANPLGVKEVIKPETTGTIGET
jgi:hypothetical protein